MPNNTIHVEVCLAKADTVFRRALVLDHGATLEQAIQQSGVIAAFPEINWAQQNFGVFSKRKQPQDLLHDGDRIEIYRPLIADPKLARQRRVQKMREQQPDKWVRR